MIVDIQILGADVAPKTLQELATLPHLIDEPHWTQAQLQDACVGVEQVLGLFVNGQAVGYMVAANIIDQADIHTLFIATDWRGRGLAKSLLKSMLVRLKKLGAKHGFLEVRQSNGIAQNLYRSFGFAITGKRVDYYKNVDASRENAILMSASL